MQNYKVRDEGIIAYWLNTSKPTVRECAREFNVSWQRVTKALSTNGITINETHAKIMAYHNNGMSADEIAELLQMNVNSVKAYLSRKRREYLVNPTINALRIRKCRQKKSEER